MTGPKSERDKSGASSSLWTTPVDPQKAGLKEPTGDPVALANKVARESAKKAELEARVFRTPIRRETLKQSTG
jgi:hypothetical protein